MRALVDTNVLIRHLVNDPPEQAERVRAFLATDVELVLPDVIAAEVAYVLATYRRTREQIAAAMRSLLTFDRFIVPNLATLLRTVDIYEQLRLDFADAYLLASAEGTEDKTVVSFDRGIGKLQGVTRLEP